MNNRSNKNGQNNFGIDLSQVPVGQKERATSQKSRDLQGKMNKKNLIYAIIIVIAFISVIILLAASFSKRTPPSQHAPPAEEDYTPPGEKEYIPPAI